MLFESALYQEGGGSYPSPGISIDGQSADLKKLTFSNLIYNSQDSYSYVLESGYCPFVYNNAICMFCSYSLYQMVGSTFSKMGEFPSIQQTAANALEYNGVIHVLGCGSGQNASIHYTFDGQHWVQLNNLPFTVTTRYSAIVFNNEIHLFKALTGSHFKWNSANDSWDTVSTLPTDVKIIKCVFVHNNELYLAVNTNTLEALGTYKLYKLNVSTWTEVSAFPQMFRPGYGVSLNGNLYVYGRGIKNCYRWNGSTWNAVDHTHIGNIQTGVAFDDDIWLFSNKWPYCEITSAPIYNVEIE